MREEEGEPVLGRGWGDVEAGDDGRLMAGRSMGPRCRCSYHTNLRRYNVREWRQEETRALSMNRDNKNKLFPMFLV